VDFDIRQARIEDADELGAVHVASWREAYFPHIMSEESLKVATPEMRAKRWRAILEDPANARSTWVAVSEGRILGFAGVGAARDHDVTPKLELYSIYVLAEAQGTGLAQALLDAALGNAPATLWVLENNPRAQSFYRRNRFVPDGTRKADTFIRDSVTEIRMIRP
jgi:GNAT superfamily N-acetyltransferase